MSSPLHKNVDLVSVDVEVGGELIAGNYSLIEVQVKKEINRIPTATVILLDGNPAEVNFENSENDAFKPGSDVKISAGYHRENEVIFEGVLLSANPKIKADDMPELILKAVDKAAEMTVERKNRYFTESKDDDVFNKIIGEYGLGKDVESTPYKHEGMIQYSSTDWDFLLSRSDMHGFIVNCDDGKIAMKKPEVSGAGLTLTYGTDIIKMDLEVDGKNQLGGVEAEGWDMINNEIIKVSAAEPAVPSQGNVDGQELSGVLGGGTLKLHSTGPIERDMLQSWADSKLLLSRMSRIRGKLIFQGNPKVKPDTLIEIKGAGARFNGEAYVSAVYHRIKEFDWDTEATIGISPQAFTETQKDIQTPPASGMLPAVHGLQVGKVQKIDEDPQGQNRILVDVPVIAEAGDGVWARQAAYYATKEAGNFFIPEVGDEVILGFLNADIRYPIILGSVPSTSQEAAYVPDGPNTYKAIVTNSKMKIEFEDVKKIMTLYTPGGNTICMNDEENTITIHQDNGNENKIVMSDKGFEFTTPFDFVVKAKGNIMMESQMNTEHTATQDYIVKGLNVTTEAQVASTVKGCTVEVNGSGQVTIKGGVVMIN
ncbi:MAG: type VI secretion system tip protein VgrG [Bacteroidota bacterium]